MMTAPLLQGEFTIARMCALAGVSRAGYYRHWVASAPREAATAIRDLIQRVALAEPHYGYRRVTFELRRGGVVVNHKRVLRLMHEDNLLCLRRRSFVPATTDSIHGWRVVPNLTHGIFLTALTSSGGPTSPTSACARSSPIWRSYSTRSADG